MSDKPFYNAESPDEAIRIYLDSRNELYEKIKEKTIREIIYRIYGQNGLNCIDILEIGPGGGIFTEFFIKQGANVFCVDVCEPILLKNKELHPEAEFILADATNVKLNKKFELIFEKDVIEHIINDEEFLRNMKGHLKDKGIIIISTQNSFCLNYLIQGGYHCLRGNKEWCGWDATHVRFYNRKSLKSKLEAAGFKPFLWFGSYYLPYRLLVDRFGKWAESRIFCFIEENGLYDKFPFSITGWNIGVVARKL